MSKKLILVLILFILGLASLCARQTDNEVEKRVFISSGASFGGQPDVFTRKSAIGFGFVILHSSKIDFRSQLVFHNGVIILEDTGVKLYTKTIAAKFSLGRFAGEGLIRTYFFLEGRIGTAGSALYDFYENPLIGNAGLGSGIEFFATSRTGFYFETGFLGNFYNGDFIPQQRFELGGIIRF